MGANITTLADTLVAAMLLGSAVAVQIVLAEAIGVSIVTIFYLAVLYKPVSTGIMALRRLGGRRQHTLVGLRRRCCSSCRSCCLCLRPIPLG